jgi:beta-lactamase class C
MRRAAAVLFVALAAVPSGLARAEPDGNVERIVARQIQAILPPDKPGGAAVALRIDGRTLYFNFGWADVASGRPITSDSLFNLASLRKLFEATVLARAVGQGNVALSDPVTRYLPQLEAGGDIRRVTLGQLATHTSGLLLRHDHPPWPTDGYTLAEFIRTLNRWSADKDHEPGRQHIYTHAGFVLLHLALERASGAPVDALIRQQLLEPLGMTSTVFPLPDESPSGRLAPQAAQRAVQGYAETGEAVGEPGDQPGYYHWRGTGQIYASARDMATFLAASLGELPRELSLDDPLRAALAFTQQPAFRITPRNSQALAWEIIHEGELTIVEKNGGLTNASSYVGMIPGRKLGIVILSNRGDQYPAEVGRCIMLALARYTSDWRYNCVE